MDNSAMLLQQSSLPGITLEINEGAKDIEKAMVAIEKELGKPDREPVTAADEVHAVLDAVEQEEFIGFDTETTGLDFCRCDPHGMSLATRDKEWYITVEGLPLCMGRIRDTLNSEKHLVIGHNLKFDLHFVHRYGIRPPRIFDTCVAAFLENENQDLALKALAYTMLGYQGPLPEFRDMQRIFKRIVKKPKMEDVTVYDIPPAYLATYAAKDARFTYDLFLKLTNRLAEEEMLDYFYKVEMPFLYTLLDMEAAGVAVDLAGLHTLEIKYNNLRDEHMRTFQTLAPGVNHASNPQLQTLLFEKLKLPVQKETSKGAPSVDVITLSRLEKKDKTGTVSALLGVRKYEKLCSTYVTALRDLQYEGRIHTNFNRTRAVTGRLSSSSPNLQNIPARGEIGTEVRKCFVAKPGCKLIVGDYSQIELRILAHFAQDRHFVKVFKEKGDPYQLTADRVKIPRANAKAINFGWAYGIGPRGLCDSIEKAGNPRPKEDYAKWLLDTFDQEYPDMVRYKQRTIEFARQYGCVYTIARRKRRLEQINSQYTDARGRAERQAVNAVIQGSAFDVTAYAMNELHNIVPWFDASILLQVHDEIVVEVPEESAEELAGIVQRVMESIEKVFHLIVPIIAEPSIVDSWGDA